MNERLKTFILSLLMPGLGYLQNDDKKSFYKTVAIFFCVIISGVMLRLLTSFWSLTIVIISLTIIYFFTAIHSTFKLNAAINKTENTWLLKSFFTVAFFLVTGLSFANRRVFMGFDIMSMDVPVMQPALLQGDRFLVDTWFDKKTSLKRKDIIVHSFNGQQGLYLNRIIAMGGDKIEIKYGTVLLNGQTINEQYVLTTNVTKTASKEMKAFVIPKGHYFVMGDNRDASLGDSRFSGTITINNIVGKATDIICSKDKSRIGKTLK
jgi:signal peptidase I